MPDPTVPERWLPVVGHEGIYEVSDLGRFRRVPLGHYHRPLVHRLVLEAFVGPCPPGMESCHGPGGSLDQPLSQPEVGYVS